MAAKINAGMQRKVLDEQNPVYQEVQPQTWTVVTYTTALGDPGSGWLSLSNGLFRPNSTHGVADVNAFIHYVDPGPGVRVIQTRIRLCRDPYNQFDGPDTTCTDERVGTSGRNFHGGWGWRMSIRPTEPLSIQAWVDTEVVEDAEVETSLGPRTLQFPVQPPQAVPMLIENAQFKLTVWA
jgi:hypothetical protein